MLPKPQKIRAVLQFGKYELIGPVRLPLKLANDKTGAFSIYYFSFPGGQYAVLQKRNPKNSDIPLVRIESICIWAHIFGSQYCDCGWQLEEAKVRIDREKKGLIIFALNQHGKGVGLRNHFMVYAEGQYRKQELVVDAYRSLGFAEDYRKNYQDIADILLHFGIKDIRLMTNNPQRIKLLRKAGIRIKRVALEMPLNSYNKEEMIIKKTKLGHLLTLRKRS